MTLIKNGKGDVKVMEMDGRISSSITHDVKIVVATEDCIGKELL